MGQGHEQAFQRVGEMSQKPTRRCSPLLARWKKPIQATMRQHFTPTRSADVCSLGLGAVSPQALGGGRGRGWALPLPQFGRLIPDSLCSSGRAPAGTVSSPKWCCLDPTSGPPCPARGLHTRPLGSAKPASLESAGVRAPFPGSQMCLWLLCPGLVLQSWGAGGGRGD